MSSMKVSIDIIFYRFTHPILQIRPDMAFVGRLHRYSSKISSCMYQTLHLVYQMMCCIWVCNRQRQSDVPLYDNPDAYMSRMMLTVFLCKHPTLLSLWLSNGDDTAPFHGKALTIGFLHGTLLSSRWEYRPSCPFDPFDSRPSTIVSVQVSCNNKVGTYGYRFEWHIPLSLLEIVPIPCPWK